MWARYISNKIQSGTTTFTTFFKKAATNSATINPEDLPFPEFSEIATSANKMLTDRIQAEKRLQQSESRLKKAQSVARIGNWKYDILTGKVWGSEEAFSIYGIKRTSPLLPLDRVQACTTDRLRVNKVLVDLINENRKYDIEFEIHQEIGGKVKWVHSIAELELKNGVPTKIIGIIKFPILTIH